MPHMPHPSDSEACAAVLARIDPNEHESVVLLDENGRLIQHRSPWCSWAITTPVGWSQC
jgi:hypothetical protein